MSQSNARVSQFVDKIPIESKEIPGHPGYRAAIDGSIWSCRKSGRPKKKFYDKWRSIKSHVGRNGYLHVVLYGRVTTKVHHLVLLAFCGPRPEGAVTRHINGNRQDNTPGNLAWGTCKENTADMRIHGTMRTGGNSFPAIFTNDEADEIRKRVSDGESRSAIARQFSVSVATISRIVSRKTYR